MKHDHKVIFVLFLLGNLLSNCNDSDSGRGGAVTAATPGTGGEPDEVTIPGLQVAFGDLSKTTLYTSNTAEESCLDFVVELTDGDNAAVADVTVSLSIQPSGPVADRGLLLPSQGVSDENGFVEGKYCSGSDELVGSLLAEAQGISATSGEITVVSQGSLKLSFKESSVPTILETPDSDPIILLNLLESGPFDCTTLYFELMLNDAPFAGQELEFLTQPDFPKGSKLAKKSAEGTVVTDAVTSRKSGSYTATSSSEGILAVPVCAGTALGTILVTGSVTDEDGKIIKAHSPVISIKGGMPNFQNFSLTFDWTNARTLKGYFNNNSPYTVTTEARVGTRFDGDPILDYQLSVHAETGKVAVANGGLINPETGTAKFVMNALHMVNQYAYPIHTFDGFPEARSRCQPEEIADSLGGIGSFSFSNLAKNWRSTLVYMIRGQEFFYDRNGNGLWDGGDGFWDKNQNGIFDGNDVLTYDHNNNASFDYDGEWFIDLPTPFIDVNENGQYDANVDIALIDDGYLPPNGSWDKDTMIWKNEIYPIYMGTSHYGMQRYRIQPNYTDLDEDLEVLWAGTYASGSRTFGIETIDEDLLWGPGATDAVMAGMGVHGSHIFAHGLCGNPVPGGTEIKILAETVSRAAYGERNISNHIYVQPDDNLLEPARRLLNDSTGGSTAVFNFNSVDHPYKEYGYPVHFKTRIAPCDNLCTGDLAVGGVACGAASWELTAVLAETEKTGSDFNGLSEFVAIPSVQTCTCATGAFFSAGNCQCPEGTSVQGGVCVAEGA
ncbi:MAG: hypothetical protein ACOH5I_01840 [Oligoflexus sp.]